MTPAGSSGAPAAARGPLALRLSVQLTISAVLPILLVSLLIGVPLIEGRRAQLMAQEQLRAEQAAQAAELLYRERLTFATRIAALLVDRPVLTQRLSANDGAGLLDFVRQTRADTLFDLVTIAATDGRVLAQDGMAELWRPELARLGRPQFWGVPGIGLVVQVSSPIVRDGVPGGIFVGSFLIDRALLGYVRAQTDLDQSILFGSQLIASSLPLRAGATVGAQRRDEVQIGGAPYLAHYLPLSTAGGRPMGTIEVLLPLAPVRAAQNQATAVLLAGTLVAASVAVWLSWYLAQSVTRPIRRLSSAATAIGRGHLDQPVAVQGPAELQLLSWTFDQTRRQLAASRAELQSERSRLANILEAIEDGVVTLDPAGRITSLNRSAERLLGIGREAAAGLPLRDVARLADEAPLDMRLVPESGAVNLALRASAGTLLVAITRSAVAAPHDDRLSEQVLVLRDVSEEVAVRQLKDDFLANMTHEFRTPLAALTASLEILRDDHPHMTDAERAHMLDTLHVGVRRLDTLVQNLLDSASIQAGYFRVETEPGALAPLIAEAADLVLPLLRQRGQTLAFDLPEELPLVLADGQRIVQVLVNLLSNAGKFGPRGDRIVLAAAAGDGSVSISVTDHGGGIAPERQGRLFERFMRPGGGARAQGAGLGLAIVKAIVERHGGSVGVRSGPDGTTFHVALPRAAGAAEAA